MSLLGGDPLVPEAGMVYWVDTTILPSGDPEDQRQVVVLEVPEAEDGTVVVVSRSGVDDFGAGGFSRRHPVLRRRWTSATVTPAGRIDDDVLAAVRARFASVVSALALAELRAGRAGPAFTAELQRTIRAVAVARNFPPPDGHPAWTADAVWSAASELMADAQTPRRLTDLAVHCATGDALRARLQGTVRNFLADLGRRTPIGKLVVRINDVLRGEAGFRLVDGRWAQAADGEADGSGGDGAGADDPEALGRAIAGIDVVVPAWGHDAHRAAPVADRATIVSLCHALLDAAGGSLTPRALARAIGIRLGIGQAPLSLDATAFDGGGWAGGAGGAGGASADSTADEALRLRRATEVLAQLNDRERLAVAYPELTVRHLAPVLGVSPSQSHVIRSRAAEVIRIELVDDDDAEGVALLVMELGRNWADAMDNVAGSAVVIAR